jgi:hypothetical protein
MPNDPKNKITDYMTDPTKAPDEKSRLMSGPQKEWYLEQDTEFRVLGWGSSKALKEVDQKNMAAFQGRRSDDLVEMMKADQDQSAIQVGVEDKVREYQKGRQGGE